MRSVARLRADRSYLGSAPSAFPAAVVAAFVVVAALAPAPTAHAQTTLDLEPAARAYAALQLEEAWTEISAVLRAIEGPDGERIPREERVRAYVLAASIARARGDLVASEAALDRALSLDLRLTLDPALHPPPLLEALERRRAALLARAEELALRAPIGDGDAPDGPRADDPWPWVGVGVGGVVLLGGAIVLAVVLAQPPSSFEVRGTIVP